MPQTTIPTPTMHEKREWRRRVRDGYRPPPAPAGTIIHAYESESYERLLRVIKQRTLYVDGCWLWSGWTKEDGSAWVSLRDKAVRVRRLVAMAFIGAPLDSRDKIWSTCSQKGCVNPEHLEIRVFKR